MKVRLILVGIAMLALALLALPASALAGTYVEPFTVITGPGNQGEPAVSSSVVLWVDDASGSTVIQQRYLPPTDPAVTLSKDTTGSRHHPAYSAGLAVWWDSRYGDGDIWAYSVLSGHEFPVHYGPGEQVEPSTSDGYVVWQDDRNGNWDIYGAVVDPATDAIKDVFPVYVGAGSQTHPVVYGNTVVWQDYRNGNWDIYGARLTGVDATHWTAGTPVAICTEAKSQTWPATDGTTVVWQDYRGGNWDIYGATLGSGETPTVTPLTDPICGAYAAQTHPQVAQELAVWQDMRDTQASASYGADIWARDMSKQVEFPVVVVKGDQVLPSLSYDTVVWEDTRSGDSDVYGATVTTDTPWSIYVQVGDGSGWTKTRNLRVQMLDVTTDVNPPVTEMLVFNDGDPVYNWLPFGPAYDILLPAGDGAKKLGIRFTDSSDTVSPLLWETITLDMTPPVTEAPNAVTVRKGAMARLPYRVDDNLSPQAAVTIEIKSVDGSTVKTLSLGMRATGKVLTTSFTCRLAVGHYRFSVKAIDRAGNAQSSMASNSLAVMPASNPYLKIKATVSGCASGWTRVRKVKLLYGPMVGPGWHVRASNGSGIWGSWHRCATPGSFLWSLPSGDGTKTVRLQYSNGVSTKTYAKMIKLDTHAPTFVSADKFMDGAGDLWGKVRAKDNMSSYLPEAHCFDGITETGSIGGWVKSGGLALWVIQHPAVHGTIVTFLVKDRAGNLRSRVVIYK